MTRTIRTGLVGVTGYAGMEMVRLLAQHPVFQLTCAASRKESGRRLDEIFPHLTGIDCGSTAICEPDVTTMAGECELVFLAVPHGTAMEMAAGFLKKGVRVVDLSADFRLREVSTYESWYGLTHKYPELIDSAVYGIPELYGAQVAGADLVANPGCYPTSVLLGLYPALRNGFVETEGIVVDSKSGTSGAGRKAVEATLFCEVHDTFRAYGLGVHRHTPEIEQELSVAAGKKLTVSFNPHLLPIDRGILSTIYTRLRPGVQAEAILEAYQDFCRPHPWLRLLPGGGMPQTRWVRGTMFCDTALVVDQRVQRLIVVTTIDNLCRGASGQALANANLMYGLDLTTGLMHPPLIP